MGHNSHTKTLYTIVNNAALENINNAVGRGDRTDDNGCMAAAANAQRKAFNIFSADS